MRISFGLCLVLLVGCGDRATTQPESLHTGVPRPLTMGSLTGNPSYTTLAPQHTETFTITGGSGTYGCTTSPLSSGGTATTSGANQCIYVAGTTPAVDKILLTDVNNASATGEVDITVAAPVVSPSTVTLLVGQMKQFTVSAEDGTADSWSANLGTISSAGLYDATTAGTATVTYKDTLDSLTSTATVSVLALVAATPSTASVVPTGTQAFALTGGSGTYTCSISVNGSGATASAKIDSTIPTQCDYVAGVGSPSGNTSDTLVFADANDASNSTQVTVTVTPAISVSPSAPSLLTLGTQTFTASGGDGTYTWSVSGGGMLDTTTGTTVKLTASATKGTETVTVTDGHHTTATATVTVGSSLAITSTPTGGVVAPKDTFVFQATDNETYTWSVLAPANGSIVASTGVYTASSAYGATDTIEVTDQGGNTATFVVTIGPQLQIATSPAGVTTTTPHGTVDFTETGGTGRTIAWSLLVQNTGSDASISSSGVYHAGGHGSQTDTIQVTDSAGNAATYTITTTLGLTITGSTTTPPRGTLTFTPSGGSDAGYAWSLTSPSGGSIVTHADSSVTYTAGGGANTTDTLQLVDSLMNQTTASITVGAGVSFVSPTTSISPMGAATYTAQGGSGVYASWTISPNHSGGTITPAASPSKTASYVAGATGMSTDTIVVTDTLGNSASVQVSVGGGIAISPSNPTVFPRSKTVFMVSGGSGSGYVYALQSGAHGTFDATTLTYTAGAGGATSQTDTLTVTDSNHNTQSTVITTLAATTLSPATVTVAPLGTQAFTVLDGTPTFAWSLPTNGSMGSIDPSGNYTAGAGSKTQSVTDVVQVIDHDNNVATATVTITPAVSLSVDNPTVPPLGSANFKASNGTAPYTFSISTAQSSGATAATINSATGAYTAGSNGSKTDTIRVVDHNGGIDTATITIGPGVSISPAAPSVAPNSSQQLTASGGDTTDGYTWSIPTNHSSATITTTGLYTAGNAMNVVDTVKVVDHLGNTATVNVSVGGGVAITPATPMSPPRGMLTFSATGGTGTFQWKLSPSASGGSINTTSGVYIAGRTGNVSDVVMATDSAGNSSSVSVRVGAPVSITPPSSQVDPGHTVTLSVSGGSGAGYVWSIGQSASGGMVDQSGTYVAGSGSGLDVVQVVDSLGNTAVATIDVKAPAPPPDMATSPDLATAPHDMAIPEGNDAAVPSDMAVAPPKKSSGCDVGGESTGPLALLIGAALILATRRRLAKARARR